MACYVIFKIYSLKDFPGGPGVETLPSSSGGVVSVPDQGAKIPQAWCQQLQDFKKKDPHQKNNLQKIHSSAVHLGLKKMLMLYE